MACDLKTHDSSGLFSAGLFPLCSYQNRKSKNEQSVTLMQEANCPDYLAEDVQ
jgi:hypothetical protein